MLLLSSIYVLFRHRRALRTRHAAIAGVLLAAGVLTRVNLLIVAPALWLYAAAVAREDKPVRSERSPLLAVLRDEAHSFDARSARAAAAFALPVAAAFGAILWLNWYRFGGVLEFNPVASGQGFAARNIAVGPASLGHPLELRLHPDLFNPALRPRQPVLPTRTGLSASPSWTCIMRQPSAGPSPFQSTAGSASSSHL